MEEETFLTVLVFEISLDFPNIRAKYVLMLLIFKNLLNDLVMIWK